MQLYDSERYMQDVQSVASLPQFQNFSDTSVLISGGTGMIGSFLVDVLMWKNRKEHAGIDVYVLGRNETKAK